MEYKINNFNLSDIDFQDLKSLSNYFEKSIPKQKINNILLGPNVLHLSNLNSSDLPLKKTPEDKKILSYLSRLIITSQNQKPEQSIIMNTNSINCTRVFLKRLLKELSLIMVGINSNTIKDNNNNDKSKIEQIKCDVSYNLSLVEFLTFFTCIKDLNNDSIPITDYDFTFTNDVSTGTLCAVKLSNINFRLFNYDLIISKLDFKNEQMINSSNINFFYMLLYSLPIPDLFKYLYNQSTREYFGIFDDEIELEDHVRRYVLINQFKLLKNEAQYEEYSKENENSYNKIKQEYEHYIKLYSRYLKIKAEIMLPEQFEQKMIGMFLGMILIAEFDIIEDPLFDNINKELMTSYSNSSIDLFSFIRNILIADQRFQYIQTKEQNNCRIQSDHILAKIALNTTISEDRILYLLMTDLVKKGKGKVNQSQDMIANNCQQLITILYQSAMDRLKQYYDSLLKSKKGSNAQQQQTQKIQFFISKSNLVYENTFKMYQLKNYPSYSTNNNNEVMVFDEKTYVISNNIREHIVNNYLQELKNYIYLNHSMTIFCNTKEQSWPKVDYNEEFTTSLLNENFNYDPIMNLYENNQCGLIRIVMDMSMEDVINPSKEENNLNNYKNNFDYICKKKNIVQLVEIYNTELESYQPFILVKHSFGTFLYDLYALFFFKQRPSNVKEQTVLKYLDYKPLYNDNYFRHNQDMSFKLLKKIAMVNVFICNTIRLSKEYKTMAILDDFKLNNIYYFYYNFFNYIINVKEVRESVIKSKAIQLTHSMIRDDLVLFKYLSKKLRISITDYYYSNGHIFARSKLSRSFDNNKNVAGMIFKYNPQLFYFLLVKKCTSSGFSYFHFIANCVKTYVKLTKIYNEKKVLSNVHNLLTDVIVDNYEIFDDENKKLKHNEDKPCNINHISKDFLPKIDKLNELVFDFNKEALSKVLPKLRANLSKLKRVWKDYISDIRYLEQNKTRFNNQKSTQLVIEQRLINFQILLFFFSKKYRFINSNALAKYGVLLTEFTKNVSSEVLILLSELNKEFHTFLKENDLNIMECDTEKLEGLIAKRVEIQKATRLQNRLKKAKILAQKNNNEFKTNDEANIIANEFDTVNDNSNRNDSNSESITIGGGEGLPQLKQQWKYTDKHAILLMQTKMKMPPQLQIPVSEIILNNDYNECNMRNIPSLKDINNPNSKDCKTLQDALDKDLRRRSKESSNNKINKYLKNYGIDPDKVNNVPKPETTNYINNNQNQNKTTQNMNQNQKQNMIQNQSQIQNQIQNPKTENMNQNSKSDTSNENQNSKSENQQNSKRDSQQNSKRDSQQNSKRDSQQNSKRDSQQNSKRNSQQNSKRDSQQNSKSENQQNSKSENQQNSQSENVVDFKEELLNVNNKKTTTDEKKGRTGLVNKNDEGSMMMTSNDSLSKVACGANNNNNNSNNNNNNEIKDLSEVLNNMDINKALANKLKSKGNNPKKGEIPSNNNSLDEEQALINKKELSDRLTQMKLLTASNANEDSLSQRNQSEENELKGPNKQNHKQNNQNKKEEENKSLKGNNSKSNSKKNSKPTSQNHSKNNSKTNLDLVDKVNNKKQKDNDKAQSLNNSKGKNAREISNKNKEDDDNINNKSKSSIKSKDKDTIGDSNQRNKTKSTNKDCNKLKEQLEGKSNHGSQASIDDSMKSAKTNKSKEKDNKGKQSRSKSPSHLNSQAQSRPKSPLSSANSHKGKQNNNQLKQQHSRNEDDMEEEGERERRIEAEEDEEEAKNKQAFKLPALKELDDKIRQLKKELNALEIMGSLTEKTTVLCFKHDEQKVDQGLLEEAEKIDKEFYDDIEEKLRLAEKVIQSQFA